MRRGGGGGGGGGEREIEREDRNIYTKMRGGSKGMEETSECGKTLGSPTTACLSHTNTYIEGCAGSCPVSDS